jgi:hypothetical protein
VTGLVEALVDPFYEGTGSSSSVPGLWDCALGGQEFMFDTKYFGPSGRQRRQSIQLLKAQQDNSGEISERSLNPEDLIRQAQEAWHKGAGQSYFDRSDSDSSRFRASKGIDVFSDRFKFQLLPDTDQKSTSASTVMRMAVAGSRLYRIDGTTVEFTTDITVGTPSWTAVTGLAGTPVSICTDGNFVYIACTASGIYRIDIASDPAAAASWATGTVTLVAWVKGRLMAAGGGNIYNVTASGALPAVLNSSLNTGVTWVAFAEGPNHIYAAGFTGTQSVFVKTTIQPDGTALAAPSVAMPFPDGETVRAMYGYLNVLFIGTDRGVWVAEPDSNGNLNPNKILDTDDPVRCFEGQDRFVWFGWSNYDAVSTGLGRLDLGVDAGDRNVITPAYASDLMASTQGEVLDVCTFQDVRVFAVSEDGFWAEDTDLVASGTLHTGLITYDLGDQKFAMYVTVAHDPLDGEVAVGVAADSAETFSAIGSNDEQASTGFTAPCGEMLGEGFELELSLTRSAADTTVGPVVTRWVFEANPAPGRGEFFGVALLFYRTVVPHNGQNTPFDVYGAYGSLLELEQSGRPITYQDAWGVDSVFLDDHEFITDSYDSDGHQGTFIAQLRRPRRRSL